VHGALEKLVNVELKSFVKCKKAGIKETIISRLGLDDCLLAVGTAAADPESSLGKAVAKLGSSRAKSCESLSMDTTFPGDCAALANDSTFDACSARLAKCRACRIIVATDAPFVDCDTFDDGAANRTCPRD
jgi:hypothetical protein